MLGGDRPAHGRGGGRRLGLAAPVDLVGHHQALRAAELHRERRPAPRTEGLVALFGGALEVLRMVIAPADHDQILPASGDEELAPGVDETEIAGAQE